MLHITPSFANTIAKGCSADLTPLLYYPTFVTDGGHGALSNNILGASPAHPFWDLLTSSIIPHSWNFMFPYVTISYATGQWFETEVWEKYHRQEPLPQSSNGNNTRATASTGQLHRIMMDMRPGAAPWVFFTQARGGTWDNWDNHLFGWIGRHVGAVVFGGMAASLMPCLCVWCCCRLRRRSKEGYSLLASQPKDQAVD